MSTTVLHGASTWAMTKTMAEDLDVARRKMLRYILRIFRRKTMQNSEDTELEPWVDYLKRAARIIEKVELSFGMESWSVQARMRKWAFAGELARRTDSRWTQVILNWCLEGLRSAGRPFPRWSDDIVAYAGQDW